MTGQDARGLFVTLEGGEGVGKSTQIARLADRLRDAGCTVIATREPGGSPKAETIRHLLLSGAVAPFGTAAEAVLFAAARQDHLDRTIRPALAAGVTVVCDRFVDSTRAYQGALGSVPLGLIDTLQQVAVGATMPDLTVVLDMEATRGLARARARRGGTASADRFEREEQAFHDTLRQAFLDIARADPGRCIVVDADRSSDAVAANIWAAVQGRLPHPVPTTAD